MTFKIGSNKEYPVGKIVEIKFGDEPTKVRVLEKTEVKNSVSGRWSGRYLYTMEFP